MHKKSILAFYYSCIHSKINYGNIASASTNVTKFKKINSQQKYAKCRANNKDIFSYSRDLLKLDKISNSYQLNILNVTTFMHTV